jgi:hypothetical protein
VGLEHHRVNHSKNPIVKPPKTVDNAKDEQILDAVKRAAMRVAKKLTGTRDISVLRRRRRRRRGTLFLLRPYGSRKISALTVVPYACV